MTSIASKPLDRYPWFIRLFLWKQKRTYGEVLVPGHCVEMFIEPSSGPNPYSSRAAGSRSGESLAQPGGLA